MPDEEMIDVNNASWSLRTPMIVVHASPALFSIFISLSSARVILCLIISHRSRKHIYQPAIEFDMACIPGLLKEVYRAYGRDR